VGEGWVGEELIKEIRGYALRNAYLHGGKAVHGPVMSKVLGRHPELRGRARELIKVVQEVVKEVNKLSLEEQGRELRESYPELIAEVGGKEEKAKELPPLPNVGGVVRTRFAPNPDFLIHLGNARPAILSHEYARMYRGVMILRFEDTDPKTKPPMPEAYRKIKEDLRWLGIEWDEEYIQSLRMRTYYGVAEELIRAGGAYVDLCSQEEFRRLKLAHKPCPHRNQSVDENLELFDRMVSGYFGEGEAVLRVKTDINHPDPSVIDWVAFRVIDTDRYPHPIVGSRYVAWPTYNFAAGVDDHLMGVTHILRGKEHSINTVKQGYLYSHLGWTYPEVINLGRLHLEGLVLSKSVIKSLLKGRPGDFSGPDDVRFGTIASLRRRGIEAEAVRALMLDVGVKPTDARVSWDNIAAANRKLIDFRTTRLMAVIKKPVNLVVKGYSGPAKLRLPNHPDNRGLGVREVDLGCSDCDLEVLVEEADISHGLRSGGLRLMECCNVRNLRRAGDYYIAEFLSRGVDDARRLGYRILQWVPARTNVRVKVLIPKGLELVSEEGFAEPELRRIREGMKVQFVRYGFVKVDEVREDEGYAKVIYMHK